MSHAVTVQVNDVGVPDAIDVGQAEALLIELVRGVEPGESSIVTLAPKRP